MQKAEVEKGRGGGGRVMEYDSDSRRAASRREPGGCRCSSIRLRLGFFDAEVLVPNGGEDVKVELARVQTLQKKFK